VNCSTSLRVLEFFKNVDKHRFYDFLKNAKVGRILTVWGPAYYNPAASRPCPFCPLDTERTRIFEKLQSRSDFDCMGPSLLQPGRQSAVSVLSVGHGTDTDF
jgi:hypothetical protein